jgi:hypothetical protein
LADEPLFVLGGGDYAYADLDRRFRHLDTAIDTWFRQMEPLLARVPFMAQYGNHEVFLGERFRDWAPRFAHPEGFAGGRSYAFDVADAHFTGLFVPGPSLDPDQLAWLDADLAAARSRACAGSSCSSTSRSSPMAAVIRRSPWSASSSRRFSSGTALTCT